MGYLWWVASATLSRQLSALQIFFFCFHKDLFSIYQIVDHTEYVVYILYAYCNFILNVR